MKKVVPTILVAAAASLGALATSHALTGVEAVPRGTRAGVPIAVPSPAVAAPSWIQLAQAEAEAPAADPARLAELMEDGAPAFRRNCAPCHGANGEGGAGPELAGSTAVRGRGGLISQILLGSPEHGMPPFDRLDDDEIAAIATFVRNSWGNEYSLVEPEQVAAARSAPRAE